MIRNYLLPIALFLAAVFGIASPSANAADTMIEMSISGDAGQMFAGDCYLLTRTGLQKRHRIKGETPTKIWLPARAARCNLQKSSAKGSLIVSLVKDGVAEVTQKSRYPFRWIVVSSSGPWGHASGGAFAARPSFQ